MKNQKGSSAVSIILAVVLTALIVGGLSYYFLSYKVQEKTYEKEAEVVEETEEIVENEEVKEEIAEENCYKRHEIVLEGSGAFGFEYPCDWDADITGGTTWSATGTVVAPDKKASFHFPAPDFGLHGTELISVEEIIVGGRDHIATTYKSGQETIVLIQNKAPGDDLLAAGIGPNLMLAYQDSKHEEALNHILKTFGFILI